MFWIGQAVSLIGTWMYFLTRNWLVLEITDSAFWLGMISGITLSPVLLLSLPAGVLADRIDKRILLVITQIIAMFLAFIIAFLTYYDLIVLWHIIILSAIAGIVHAIEAPSRQSYLVELVGKKDLLNAIALNSSIFNSARMLGPALAGFLINIIGMAGVFLVNAISFLGVVVALLFIKSEYRAPPRTSSPLDDLKEGVHYVRNHKVVRNLIIVVATVSLFGMSYLVLLPYFTKFILGGGTKELGILMGANGIGALIGALGLAAFSDMKKRGKVVFIASIIFSVGVILFSFSRNFYLSIIPLPFLGLAMVSMVATTNTILQTIVEDNIRGRIMSFFTFMFLGIMPIGSFLTGILSDLYPAPVVLRIGAISAFIIIMTVFIKTPSLIKDI